MSALRDALAEDLPELKDEMGDDVTYTHKPGNTVQSVVGIIADKVPEATFPGKNLTMKFFVADLSPYPVQGDEVVYSGATYKVTDVKSTNGIIAKVALRRSA